MAKTLIIQSTVHRTFFTVFKNAFYDFYHFSSDNITEVSMLMSLLPYLADAPHVALSR